MCFQGNPHLLKDIITIQDELAKSISLIGISLVHKYGYARYAKIDNSN